jgi:hypothetical protein
MTSKSTPRNTARPPPIWDLRPRRFFASFKLSDSGSTLSALLRIKPVRAKKRPGLHKKDDISFVDKEEQRGPPIVLKTSRISAHSFE